jgi:hypothetical protein
VLSDKVSTLGSPEVKILDIINADEWPNRFDGQVRRERHPERCYLKCSHTSEVCHTQAFLPRSLDFCHLLSIKACENIASCCVAKRLVMLNLFQCDPIWQIGSIHSQRGGAGNSSSCTPVRGDTWTALSFHGVKRGRKPKREWTGDNQNGAQLQRYVAVLRSFCGSKRCSAKACGSVVSARVKLLQTAWLSFVISWRSPPQQPQLIWVNVQILCETRGAMCGKAYLGFPRTKRGSVRSG